MSNRSLTQRIRRIWTPADTRRTIEDAHIVDLGERVFAAAAAAGQVPGPGIPNGQLLIEAAVAATDQIRVRCEQIADMLNDWPARIVCPVVIP